MMGTEMLSMLTTRIRSQVLANSDSQLRRRKLTTTMLAYGGKHFESSLREVAAMVEAEWARGAPAGADGGADGRGDSPYYCGVPIRPSSVLEHRLGGRGEPPVARHDRLEGIDQLDGLLVGEVDAEVIHYVLGMLAIGGADVFGSRRRDRNQDHTSVFGVGLAFDQAARLQLVDDPGHPTERDDTSFCQLAHSHLLVDEKVDQHVEVAHRDPELIEAGGELGHQQGINVDDQAPCAEPWVL